MNRLLNACKITKPILHDGNVEALKWLALLIMTIDHINHFVCNMQVPVMYEIGRIAMPLFGFVLAYNLARPHATQRQMHVKVIKRLCIFGIIATPFYVALNRWWPVNIMFTLLLATYLIYLIETGARENFWKCVIVFFVGGFFVEYFWFVPAYCLAAWWYCKQPSYKSGLILVTTTALLYVINQNHWSLVALPLIYLVSRMHINIPHLRLAFYIYYPLHLAGLMLIKYAFLK
jgi:hypothetical protein